MINKVLGLLGLCAKSRNIVCGTDACIEAMNRKEVELTIVAEDASEKTKKNIKFVCDKNEILICFFGTIEEISKAIGKKNKAIISIKDKNFSDELLKIINGGGIIE